MKAIVYHQYGSPEVLRLEEVEKPIPKDDEVLVKVHAASVNSWDWDLVRGKPYLYRLIFGVSKPKYKIIGSDIAGRVEAAGRHVKQFQPGDEVLGDISGQGFGAFAEYVCAKEEVLATKPAGMTYEEAAAVPQAGVLALQGLQYNGQLHPGQKVLINGAGGGVGTFALQFAKIWGAEVTGVDSPEKQEKMRSLGAHHVIDYTKEDFTKNHQHYDLILDVVARRTISGYKRALRDKGTCVIIGGSVGVILQTALLGSWLSGPKKMGILMHKPNREDLNTITTLIEAGKVSPVIDRCYPLKEVPAAIQYLGEGHALGKVVISM